MPKNSIQFTALRYRRAYWRTVLMLAICLCFYMVSPCLSQSDWVWLNPLPQGNTLNAVHFIDERIGIAVGKSGTIIRTTDGGDTWTIQRCARNVETLSDVHFGSASTGTAVGNYRYYEPMILRTTDGGFTWTPQISGTNGGLNAVFFTSASTGIVVAGGGMVLKTTDGGITWTPRTSGTDRTLSDVTFVDANTGFAVGGYRTVLRTLDAGETWATVSVSTTRGSLRAVAFADPVIGLAVGNDGIILRTVNGGQSWNRVPSGVDRDLQTVTFLSATTAIVPTPSGSRSNSTGFVEGSTLIRSTDAGVTWTVTPGGGSAAGVARLKGGVGIGVGFNGDISRTTDDGVTWERLAQSFAGRISEVIFPELLKGYALANRGTAILRTVDGGWTWTPDTSSLPVIVNTMSFTDALNGVAIGPVDTMLRTTDGGYTWTVSPSGTDESLHGLSMVDANTGTAVGRNGAIVRTEDGGLNWTAQESGVVHPLWDVCAIDASTAVAVGDYTILRTTDGGDTWIDVPFENGNEWLYGVDFADDMVGFAVGDFASILRTTDGGVTWTIQLNYSDDAPYYFDVDCADARNAIVVGSYGPAGDIVRTTDGGDTWEAYPCTPERGAHSVYFGNGMAIVTAIWGKMLRAEAPFVGRPLTAVLDIKPGSCPNPFNIKWLEMAQNGNGNPKKGGVLPAAIIGDADIDVSEIDVSTLRMGGLVPLRSSYEDVGGPAGDAQCECTTDGPDGVMDLTLKFSRMEVAGLLGSVHDGDVVSLEITGYMNDGSSIEGSDCILVGSKNGDSGPQEFQMLPAANARRYKTTLLPNSPNPFNPTTMIRFTLENAVHVTLSIYDAKGRLVTTLIDDVRSAGPNEARWDGTTASGASVSSGVYFYRMTAPGFSATKKMVLLK